MKSTLKALALTLTLILLCGAMTSCSLLPKDLIDLPEWNFTGLDPLLSLIFGDNIDGIYETEKGDTRYEFEGETVRIILSKEAYEELLEGTGLTYEGEIWLNSNGDVATDESISFKPVTGSDGTSTEEGDFVYKSDIAVTVRPGNGGVFVYDTETGKLIGGDGSADTSLIFDYSTGIMAQSMILEGTYRIEEDEIFITINSYDNKAKQYVAGFFTGSYLLEKEKNGDLYLGSDFLIKVD